MPGWRVRALHRQRQPVSGHDAQCLRLVCRVGAQDAARAGEQGWASALAVVGHGAGSGSGL